MSVCIYAVILCWRCSMLTLFYVDVILLLYIVLCWRSLYDFFVGGCIYAVVLCWRTFMLTFIPNKWYECLYLCCYSMLTLFYVDVILLLYIVPCWRSLDDFYVDVMINIEVLGIDVMLTLLETWKLLSRQWI